VWLRDDGDLHWIGDVGRGKLQIPSVVNRARLAGRPGMPRVAVVADGTIVVYDLTASMPRRVPGPPFMRVAFVDDDTLLVMRGMQTPWEWLDLTTGKATSSGYRELQMPVLVDIDPGDGRVLVREMAQRGPRTLLLRKNTKTVDVVAEGEQAWARLIAGGALVYALGDGQIFAKVGDEPARMVVKVDGAAGQAVSLGDLQFAAHSTSGEVVKVDLRTSKLERMRVPIGVAGFVATDSAGHVLVAEDTRLLLWDGRVTEIARFDRAIQSVAAVDGGVAVMVGKEREIQIVEVKANATPHRVLAASLLSAVARNGKLIAGLGNAKEVTLVELPSRVKWTLPALSNARQGLELSPGGRAVAQNTDAGVVVWKLPRIGTDYVEWLDERSNAIVDKDGVLVWPWLKRP
jgi:hypothetical protein